jgi:hypothetical protein
VTKSKGIGRGGHRKGAGRPPFTKTGKASYFSTRIPQKTRDLLEAEAQRQGHSLSMVAERLLQLGLSEKARNRQRSPIRAFTYLIESLTRKMELLAEDISVSHTKYTWRSNPYMFEAFRTAVLAVLNELRPSGEIVTPPFAVEEDVGWHPLLKEPQEYGHQLAFHLLLDMQVSHYYEKTRASEVWRDFKLSDYPDDIREHYGLVDARQDLGLKGPIEKLDKELGEESS